MYGSTKFGTKMNLLLFIKGIIYEGQVLRECDRYRRIVSVAFKYNSLDNL